jgi:hypothetical protein
MKKIVFVFTALFLVFNFFGQTYKVGDKLDGEDNGQWYQVTILEVKDGKYFIKWDNYSDSYNQWITGDKLRKRAKTSIGFNVGDKLEGIDLGVWYPVTILEVKDGKYKIHWDGYDDSYDKWVNASELRKKGSTGTSEYKSVWGDNRISIIYLENRTGQNISYSYSGSGSTGGGSIFNSFSENIKDAPIGGTIEINGKFFMKIEKIHDGKTIVIDNLNF